MPVFRKKRPKRALFIVCLRKSLSNKGFPYQKFFFFLCQFVGVIGKYVVNLITIERKFPNPVLLGIINPPNNISGIPFIHFPT